MATACSVSLNWLADNSMEVSKATNTQNLAVLRNGENVLRKKDFILGETDDC
ncbi:hypothetical protein NON20_08930 [Synechocystis sp. B12]|uniref:hypothetical protein n=1 Tax=Synechocystis sp. PCC 6803 TaxID=1148 RepID=UPI000307D9C7|nr:hypothetical protein [Synechocystis sp. PCC 6803]WLT39581.1 hypothetical protein NON20_08930 [Synechocystis sp. B12]